MSKEHTGDTGPRPGLGTLAIHAGQTPDPTPGAPLNPNDRPHTDC